MSDELGFYPTGLDWRIPKIMFLTPAGLCQLSMELETNGGIRMKYLFWSLGDPKAAHAELHPLRCTNAML